MEIEVEGIVLDAFERARSSQLVEIVSAEGLMTFLASSSTVKTSVWNRQDLIQPLHLVHYSLEKNKEWYKLKEGQTLERFENLRSDLPCLNAAQQMRWSIKKIAQHGLECSKLYIAFLTHLRLLNEKINPPLVLASFLSKALYLEGHLSLYQPFICPECKGEAIQGSPLDPQAAFLYFNQEGLACQKHSGLGGIRFSYTEYQLYSALACNRSISRIKQLPDIGFDKILIEVMKQLNI